jgi:cytochrome c553
MRLLILAGLAAALSAVLAAPPALARAFPDPQQKPAPGNEAAQTPIAQAGYSTATNYQLQCAGCHLGSGEGAPRNDTPRMSGFVGNFLRVEGGREFLVRVPGVAQAALSDAQIAELLNWILDPQHGMAGASSPAGFRPYSAEEVGRVRHEAILNLPGTRAGLIARMRAQGIAIDDGMGAP